jgi:hypothetical protein
MAADTAPQDRAEESAPYGGAFLDELTALLNRHSMENGSDTPDFILAEYLAGCLTQWNVYSRKREAWYGCESTKALQDDPVEPSKEQR